MNQISLIWTHAASTPLYTVEALGLTFDQLRHYSKISGFREFADCDGNSDFIASVPDCKDAFREALESAGYEIAEAKIVGVIQ